MRTRSRVRRPSSSRSIRASTAPSNRWAILLKRDLPCCTLAYLAFRPVSLEPALDGVQELERGAAVEDAVVEGDLQVHHAAHGDGVVQNDGTLDDGFRGEDRRLRVIDDRCRDHTTQSARVVDGERAARDVFGAELAGAGTSHQLVDLAGEPEDVQLVGVSDDGH